MRSIALWGRLFSAPPSFPLRRLPDVALQEVLKHMDLIEQIELSFCSKKCIQLVKTGRRNNKLLMRLVGMDDGLLTMFIEYKDLQRCFLKVHKNRVLRIGMGLCNGIINGRKFQYRGATGHNFETFWDDEMTGTVEIFKYITDLFQYPRIRSIFISKSYPIRPLYEWIAEKYNGRVVAVDEWTISVKERSHVYWYGLMLETHRLGFGGAKWLDLNDLIKFSNQSVILELHETSLTSEELNGFLKHWIKLTHPIKTRYIFMTENNVDNYDIDVILSEIEHTPRGVLLDHPFKEYDYLLSLRTKTGFTIQRNNGELASIFFSQDLSTSFEMIIH
ncbi:unnamed protein product [Caenorhabditis brenneri]